MAFSIAHDLKTWGPAQSRSVSVSDARAYCRALTLGHGENFSVLSRFVPADRRDDFAAVYAFCRWADDLGDEVGDSQRASELLAWWRTQLHACFEGEATHPVYVALNETRRQRDLPRQPFDDLITAFELDQTQARYDTWQQVLDYCRLSADPVGRLVLMLLDEPRTDELFEPSDAICTALQLTNHWQDVARDMLQRDRIYVPRELHRIDDFEHRLRASAMQGYGVDRAFLGETRIVIKQLVERTWTIWQQGEVLLQRVQPAHRPIIWLFVMGGQHVLRSIELWNYETALHRPSLSKATRIGLVASATVRHWVGGFSDKAVQRMLSTT
jgi:squalene synthase HpnC